MDSDARLPTALWVAAQIRRLNSLNMPAYVIRRGDNDTGTVIVSVFAAGGYRVFSQSRDIDGNMGWMDVFPGTSVDAEKARDYTQRAAARDPDLWVIEVENSRGDNPFEGKIL